MSRRKRNIVLIFLLIILEVSLVRYVHLLKSYRHPLLSSLTCIQTKDADDIYWNINQIELCESISKVDGSVKITLINNIPNYDSYLFRTDTNEGWKKTEDAEIDLKLREGVNVLEVKGKNKFGEEIPAIKYELIKTNDSLRIIPEGRRIVKGKYNFRFDSYESPKINWLRQYTLPVVKNLKNQWEKYLVLRKWVKEQIPYKDPVLKSNWDAQRILQTVWEDPAVGFICDAYAATYTSVCISVGLNARMIHLESSEGNGHYAAEIWSDDYKKWIFMDPLYSWYFTLHGVPLSTLELHNLWKSENLSGIEKVCDSGNVEIHLDTSERDYYNLFQDIKLINSNDFLSNPFTSAFDLLTLKIRYIRWIDESSPMYNKVKLACKILLFYYLPKLADNFIIPFFIPFLLVLFIIGVFKKRTQSIAFKKVTK